MPTTTIHEIAIDYAYSMLKNIDLLHGPPTEEPQKGLIQHALIKYNPIRELFFFVKTGYVLTPKGCFVLSEIERERNKTTDLEEKTLTN